MSAKKKEAETNDRLIEALVAKFGLVQDDVERATTAHQDAVVSDGGSDTAALTAVVRKIIPKLKGDFSPISLFERVKRDHPSRGFDKAMIYSVVKNLRAANEIAQVQKGSGKRPALYRFASVVPPEALDFDQ